MISDDNQTFPSELQNSEYTSLITVVPNFFLQWCLRFIVMRTLHHSKGYGLRVRSTVDLDIHALRTRSAARKAMKNARFRQIIAALFA